MADRYRTLGDKTSITKTGSSFNATTNRVTFGSVLANGWGRGDKVTLTETYHLLEPVGGDRSIWTVQEDISTNRSGRATAFNWNADQTDVAEDPTHGPAWELYQGGENKSWQYVQLMVGID